MFIKYLITLKSDDNEELDKGGKIALEIKKDMCELFVWLYYLNKETFYSIYLIFLKDELKYTVYITDIYIDNEGFGQLKYIFKIDEVIANSCSFSLEEFEAIAITKVKQTALKIELIGFKNDEFELGSDFIEAGLNTKTLHNNKTNNKTKLINIFDKPSDNDLTSSKNSSESVFAQLFIDNHNIIKPFEKQSRDVIWRKLNENDLNTVVELKEIMYNIKLEKTEYILGFVTDNSGTDYYFGVYSNFDRNLQHLFYEHGFFQFKCLKDKIPDDDDEGYFLVKL